MMNRFHLLNAFLHGNENNPSYAYFTKNVFQLQKISLYLGLGRNQRGASTGKWDG